MFKISCPPSLEKVVSIVLFFNSAALYQVNSFGCGSRATWPTADSRTGHVLKLLNLIDLLFDSHLSEPEAFVYAPLL
jgi:hypothetical protein